MHDLNNQLRNANEEKEFELFILRWPEVGVSFV
jgi:hypothetical protein